MSSDQCPNCGLKVERSKDAQSLPFCSKRCQMVDLGKWFQGEYSIASGEQPDEFELEELLERENKDE